MDAALEAFEEEWWHGDRAKAKELASAYVEAHRAEIEPHLGGLSLDTIVLMVSDYRRVGRESDRIIADMWLITEHPQQRVTGTIAKVL